MKQIWICQGNVRGDAEGNVVGRVAHFQQTCSFLDVEFDRKVETGGGGGCRAPTRQSTYRAKEEICRAGIVFKNVTSKDFLMVSGKKDALQNLPKYYFHSSAD